MSSKTLVSLGFLFDRIHRIVCTCLLFLLFEYNGIYMLLLKHVMLETSENHVLIYCFCNWIVIPRHLLSLFPLSFYISYQWGCSSNLRDLKSEVYVRIVTFQNGGYLLSPMFRMWKFVRIDIHLNEWNMFDFMAFSIFECMLN